MTYNAYLDVAMTLRYGVSPYLYDEVPEPGEMTTTAEVAANDAWLAYRLAQWTAPWRADLTVEDAHAIEDRIVREWFGECDDD